MPSINESLLNSKIDTRLEPIDRGIFQASGPTEPNLPSYSRFLATPLPIISTYQPDALRQFYRGGIPQQRLFPVTIG